MKEQRSSYQEVGRLKEGLVEAVFSSRGRDNGGSAVFSFCFSRTVQTAHGDQTTTGWMHRKHLESVTKLLPRINEKLLELEVSSREEELKRAKAG